VDARSAGSVPKHEPCGFVRRAGLLIVSEMLSASSHWATQRASEIQRVLVDCAAQSQPATRVATRWPASRITGHGQPCSTEQTTIIQVSPERAYGRAQQLTANHVCISLPHLGRFPTNIYLTPTSTPNGSHQCINLGLI